MADGVSPTSKTARTRLWQVADTKRVLGHWYLVSIPNGRALPDFNALAALGQGALGHARALYRLLGNEAEPDPERTRSQSDLASMAVLDEAPESWPDFVTTCFLVERALTAEIATLGPDQPFAGLLSKIADESVHHELYTTGWMDVLKQTAPDAVDAVVRRRGPSVLHWLGPDYADAARVHFIDGVERVLGPDAFFESTSTTNKPWDETRRRPDDFVIPDSLWELVRHKELENVVIT